MADSESVHMTPPSHGREFCVMCCVASRIACSSVEISRKKITRHIVDDFRATGNCTAYQSAFLDPLV